MWLHLLACVADEAVDGPTPVYRPDSALFFDAPWPDDDRRDEDGTIAFGGFPNPFASALMANYLERADTLTGFGASSPVHVLFDGPLDGTRMPTPEESLSDDASVLLLDIDPASPFFLERFPLQWEQATFELSPYAPQHLLSVAPLHGFPLRPATTYALVVTTKVARREADWARTWDRRDQLRHALSFVGLAPEDVAIATTFTTQDPVDEMRRLSWFVRERIERPPAEHDIELLYPHSTYDAYRTHYASPVFTFGTPPYLTEGGEFRFDEDGTPQVARFDDLRLAVCVPNDLEPPAEGWPVVVYQHGTGGDYRGFCDSDSLLEVARRLGERGIVGLGIDQPLHGTRPGASQASDLAHFNVVNPDSGTTNFRQGALDALYLTHALASEPWTFHGPDGLEVVLDPERVMFMGHSQGGLTGALAAPFFGDDVKAAMLSGAGGVLAITVIERKDPLDFEALVRELVEIPDGEPLTPLHPTMGVVQTLVEVTDPVNYAPYWYSQRGTWDWQAPVPVLLTSGTEDAATPFRTALALAAAGRLPWVGDAATHGDALRLRTGAPRPLPSSDDGVTWMDGRVTSGFSQYLDGTHFVIFEERDASDLAFNWLDTTARGHAVLTVEPVK
ncbi:MAG: hypothetical protein KC621_23755 [Myxococcales bacterium]|nr:hypothetical protein [Myxococcales bacterium]